MKSCIHLFFLLAIIIACKKESTPIAPEVPKTKATLLTKQPWNQVSLEFGTPGKTVIQYATDGTKYFLDFSKSRRVFNTNNKYENRDFSGNITTENTWKLVNDEKEIELFSASFNRTSRPKIEVDENKLVFSFIFKKADTPAARWTELSNTLKNIGYTGTYDEIVLNETFKAEK